MPTSQETNAAVPGTRSSLKPTALQIDADQEMPPPPKQRCGIDICVSIWKFKDCFRNSFKIPKSPLNQSAIAKSGQPYKLKPTWGSESRGLK
ncbi:UNVERIFIED_CONTAM: hypothetical protein HDU68_010829 [Siphonaria sp. JEL0065]|nr:hypothetical protein HDU68_010829 [Siphonaria sp. JEL0065]